MRARSALVSPPFPHTVTSLRRTVRRILVGIISLAVPACLTRAAIADGAANDVPIELPKLTISGERELPPPESWRYAEAPRFIVLSNASGETTQRLMRDLELFEMALGTVWPAIQSPARIPTTLIFCGRGGAFDSFKPADPASAATGTASLLFPDPEQPTIVIDIAARTIDLAPLDLGVTSDGASPAAQNEVEVDHYRQLYREYTRFLFSRTTPRLPVWFEEGMAQLVMSMEFSRRRVVFGKIDDPAGATSVLAGDTAANSGATDAMGDGGDALAFPGEAPVIDSSFNVALAHRALMPMDTMFAVTRDSPVARNPIGNAWAKQSAAFVHLCLYGRGRRFQKPFLAFVARCAREPANEAMFKECFGRGYDKMLGELRAYVEFTDYDFQQYNIKGGGFPEPARLDLREASQAEIGRIKGETLRAAGKAEAARNEMTLAYLRGERDPRLLASLGLIKLELGEKEDAAKLLDAATTAKVGRFRAYIELARLRYEQARAQPGGAEGKFSAAQTVAVLRPLFAVRAQKTVSPELYELIADAWTASVAAPTYENLGALTEGVRQFPHDVALVLKAADLFARHGFKDEAKECVLLGLKIATDDATRRRFAEIQQSIGAPSQ
jgi:hypothetical protein